VPTYDYHCDACEHDFEHFQTISSPVLKKCPKCGKNKLRRLFGTGAALVFKGSGFYTTDYRSESYKKGASADKPAGEGATSGESKSSEANSSDKASGDKASGEKSTGKAESSGKADKKSKRGKGE